MEKGLVPFLNAKEIQKIVQRLAHEITRDYLNKELVIISPLKGAVFFLSDLIRAMNLKVVVDFVLIDGSKAHHFMIKKDISQPIKNKPVLIVDSIIDSGLTLSFLMERVKLNQPESLKTAVLLDKSSRRRVFVELDYVGKVMEDHFIVGYGMHLEGEGRAHPDIYMLGQ